LGEGLDQASGSGLTESPQVGAKKFWAKSFLGVPRDAFTNCLEGRLPQSPSRINPGERRALQKAWATVNGPGLLPFQPIGEALAGPLVTGFLMG